MNNTVLSRLLTLSAAPTTAWAEEIVEKEWDRQSSGPAIDAPERCMAAIVVRRSIVIDLPRGRFLEDVE